MGPAADLDDVAVAVQVVVDGVSIGDQVARVAGQQAVDRRAVVASRVPKQHVLLWRHGDPEVACATALLGQHEDARRIHAQVRLLHRVRPHRLYQRSHQLRQLLMPRAQRRLRNRQALSAVDPFQPIERLVVLPAPHHRVGQQARPRHASRDGQVDRIGRPHFQWGVAVPILADILLVDDLDDDCGGRPSFEHGACLGAEEFEGLGIALHVGRDELDPFAGEIVRQWPAHGLCAGVLRDDLVGRQRRCGRFGVTAPKRQAEHQQRQLRVVLR